MLRTNTRQYIGNINKYILDCIENPDEEITSAQGKINYLFNEFERVANYPNNIRNIPNRQDRLADYLMGLPFNFDFSNYNILQVAKKLHESEIPEDMEEVIICDWWKHLAYFILKLGATYDR